MATVPTPITTWAQGDLLTTAALNSQLRDGPALMLRPPSCKVYRTTSTNQTNGDTTTQVSFEGERWDTDGMWTSGTPTRVTFQTSGVYRIVARLNWNATSGTGQREIVVRLYNSGGTQIRFYRKVARGNPAGWHGMDGAWFIKATAGQYIALQPVQLSGGTISYGYCSLTAHWVGTGGGGYSNTDEPEVSPQGPFKPGDLFTDSLLATSVGGALKTRIEPTACGFYDDGVAQSVTTGDPNTLTTVYYASAADEEWGTRGGWASGDWGTADYPDLSRVVVPDGAYGLYLLTAFVEYAPASAASDFEFALGIWVRRGTLDTLVGYVNWPDGNSTNAVGTSYSVTAHWNLVDDDILWVRTYHRRGSSLNIQRVGFWAVKVGGGGQTP